MSMVTDDEALFLKQRGWEKKVDPTSGRPYYLNLQTKATQWEPPNFGGPPAIPAAAPAPSNPGYAQQQFAQPPINNAPAAGSQDIMAQMMMMQMMSNQQAQMQMMRNQQAQNAALMAAATRNSGRTTVINNNASSSSACSMMGMVCRCITCCCGCLL